MSVPKSGHAVVNDFVPSIGSRTQTHSASGRSLPNSSPMMPWDGKAFWICARIRSSAPRSAAVTGDWSDLSSTARSLAPKNGRMNSPLDSARSSARRR